uniref:E3 ubiquitin-protein ligase Os03g0188200-like n=1 Tax=Nicotiana sylvestris TaxID=4096 RepID=A0A1U7VZ65_NICSY|nr:PREDICTED: E3 ubiquitin-protein ligase Os03g0188200-like [Nicotiana sylvestris]
MPNLIAVFFVVFIILVVLLYFYELITHSGLNNGVTQQRELAPGAESGRYVTTERARAINKSGVEVVIDIPDEIKGTNSDCCICLGEFDEQEDDDDDMSEVILVACCHRFHAACITPWLLVPENETCPFCRTYVTALVHMVELEDLIKTNNYYTYI